MDSNSTTRLRGVMVALATPLDADQHLDHAGLERLLARVLQQPLTGVCPSGSTGEGPLLSRQTRVELLKACRAVVPQDRALIPGVRATTVDDVLADLDAYAAAGATAGLVAQPYYYPLDAESVEAFYLKVAEHSPLPLVIYNYPGLTKISVAPAVVGRLAADPRFIGIKDSSRDVDYLSAVIGSVDPAEEFGILTGTDGLLLPSLALGAHGTIAASVNVAAPAVQALYDAYLAGREDEARRYQQVLRLVNDTCRRLGAPRGFKTALAALGVCEPFPAFPVPAVDADTVAALGKELAELGIS